MNKKELRSKYKLLRNHLTDDAIIDGSLAIANRIVTMNIWDNTYFHLFLTIEKQREIDTEFILQVLAGKDKEIVVSKSDFVTFEMSHFLLTDNTKFRTNAYNIPEPINGLEVPADKIDVVFVPLLAFDRAGHRVGYGKGFYDKFLSKCKPDVIKIGLSFFEAEEVISDATDEDVKLDFCITPDRIYSF
jgi:5-formyltetrahydrofolate cyclo-ligase